VHLHEKSDIINDELALGNHLATYKTREREREREESLLNLALGTQRFGQGHYNLASHSCLLFVLNYALSLHMATSRQKREMRRVRSIWNLATALYSCLLLLPFLCILLFVFVFHWPSTQGKYIVFRFITCI
jgi:hypothetical protein